MRSTSPLWSDGATAERFLAVPGDGSDLARRDGHLELPRGLGAGADRLDRAAGRRPAKPAAPRNPDPPPVEASLAALLVSSGTTTRPTPSLAEAGGSSRTIAVADPDAPAGRREPTYRFHARTECILCHNPWVEQKTTIFGVQSASPLGLNTPQLNRDRERDGGEANVDAGGGPSNQVEWLSRLGLLESTPDLAKLPVPRLADPYDDSADLDLRARSYLQANCSHCHQFNAGGTANIALGIEVPLDQTRTVGERPIQGTFGIAGARIIAPGEPDALGPAITGSPSWAAAGCPGSARTRSTSGPCG